MGRVTDVDLSKKVRKTCERISENLYVVANEPTLACYRIAEHLYKNGSPCQEKRFEMKKLETQLKGGCYDMEYTISALKSIEQTRSTFQNIKDLLRDAHFYKKQIDYERNRARDDPIS